MKKRDIRFASIPSTEEVAAERERLAYQNRYQRVLRSTIYILVVVAAVAVLLATLFLPVLQVSGDSVLQIAAGHLEGTSLPVGGASTHAVISAHRGLPSAKLFTNLDQLEVGDTFTITVLDRVLTYEVDKISIVLPTETDELKIAEGKDYVTLMTCTPYGINTHRLLVRGRRVETPDQYKHLRVTAEALKIEPIIVAPIMALPMLLILLIGMLISTRKPKKTRGEEHEKH